MQCYIRNGGGGTKPHPPPPDVLFCNMHLELLIFTDNNMDDVEIAMDQEQSQHIPLVKRKAGKVKKSKNIRKGDQKTKAANPFGQFLKFKRKDGKFDFKKACQEWAGMSGEEKDYYRKCYEEDKSALIDTGKEKKDSESEKQSKKSRSKKGPKVKKQTGGTTSNIQLLLKVESLDSELEQLGHEAKNLTDLICGEKVQLAVNQYKLDEKTMECNSFREKIKTLLSQHSSCLVADLLKK